MKIKQNHVYAAKMMAAGYKMKRIALQLGVAEVTISKWKRDPDFIREMNFWRERTLEIFDETLKNSMCIVSDRLLEILVDGKDADSLGAIDKIIRVQGAYKDTMTVKTENSGEESAIDRIEKIFNNIQKAIGSDTESEQVDGNEIKDTEVKPK